MGIGVVLVVVLWEAIAVLVLRLVVALAAVGRIVVCPVADNTIRVADTEAEERKPWSMAILPVFPNEAAMVVVNR